jgi:hypothetical protein
MCTVYLYVIPELLIPVLLFTIWYSQRNTVEGSNNARIKSLRDLTLSDKENCTGTFQIFFKKKLYNFSTSFKNYKFFFFTIHYLNNKHCQFFSLHTGTFLWRSWQRLILSDVQFFHKVFFLSQYFHIHIISFFHNYLMCFINFLSVHRDSSVYIETASVYIETAQCTSRQLSVHRDSSVYIETARGTHLPVFQTK